MTEDVRLAGETLNRMSPLRWYRLSAGRHSIFGYYQVPFLGWRFEHPDKRLLDTIKEAVRSTPTATAWEIDISRRNWLLAPSVILNPQDAGKRDLNFDERIALAMQDQEFCIQALADLNAIVRTLRDMTSE